MKKILIRADDLGYSEAVNYGIAKTVKEGIIRSVGIMPNMPAAQHGIDLLKGVSVCYGLHTNICVGRPLTPPEVIPSICRENGEFKPSRAYRTAELDFVDLDEVILEIEAQYQRFIELTGEKPHYFEGHAIRSNQFSKGLEIVAARHGCDFLGNPPNHNPRFRNTVLHTKIEFMKPNYNPFETLKRAALAVYPENEMSMVIYHPGYLDAYIMRNSSLLKQRVLEVEAACSEETKIWMKEHEIQVATYDDLL